MDRIRLAWVLGEEIISKFTAVYRVNVYAIPRVFLLFLLVGLPRLILDLSMYRLLACLQSLIKE